MILISGICKEPNDFPKDSNFAKLKATPINFKLKTYVILCSKVLGGEGGV